MNVVKQNKKMILLIAAAFLAGFIARDIGSSNSIVNASDHIPNLPAEIFAKGALLRISTSEGISTGQVLDAYDTWIKIKEENDRYAYWLDTSAVSARYSVISPEKDPK
ncbi:MAG: hypothetical protein IT366_22215 [Candidatus Hydrogenedentes bacterium]|nr:hypothetical protein [Candidatus Hydrogenedentota bacterium]